MNIDHLKLIFWEKFVVGARSSRATCDCAMYISQVKAEFIQWNEKALKNLFSDKDACSSFQFTMIKKASLQKIFSQIRQNTWIKSFHNVDFIAVLCKCYLSIWRSKTICVTVALAVFECFALERLWRHFYPLRAFNNCRIACFAFVTIKKSCTGTNRMTHLKMVPLNEIKIQFRKFPKLSRNIFILQAQIWFFRIQLFNAVSMFSRWY